MTTVTNKPVLFTGSTADPATLSEVVGQAVGAASVCWESMSGTGVFQDDRARQIAGEVVGWVEAQYRQPNLGLATTQQLIDELTARIEVDGANGGGGLAYRTVDDR